MTAHPTWPDPRLMSHPNLNMLLARLRTDDLYRDADVARRAGEARRAAKPRRSARPRGHGRAGLSTELATPERAITLRCCSAEDHGPLARLAALDSSKPPHQPVVVAEVGGELRAALSLNDGSLVADPFHLTRAQPTCCVRTRGSSMCSRTPASALTRQAARSPCCALKTRCREVHPINPLPRRSHETQAPDPGLAAVGGVCDQSRHDDRQRRAAVAGSAAARVRLAAAVGRGRFQFAVRGIGAGGGQPV